MSWKKLFRTKSIDQITRDAALVEEHGGSKLKKILGVWDLTALGVAAVLGAGVFSTIGNAAYDGGPAVIFLFIFTAIACAFSALCYAEFASSIPVAGSAYTYAYASFGEVVAWIIGWDLLMEYAIGNIAVAISWSQYLVSLLAGYGIRVPHHFTMDFPTASRGYHQVQSLLNEGQSLASIHESIHRGNLSTTFLYGYEAWNTAPRILGFPLICDIPTLLITGIITWIVYIGIRESKIASNILVVLKIAVVFLVVVVGATYIQPSNWVPFAPNGIRGVLKGVSAVFFAYIGFDAISTTAEECKDPQRDLPKGMIYSLVICTILYSLVSLVLTGVTNYKKLGVGDPLSFVFGPEGANLPWMMGVVDVSAIIALSTVLLVFQIGQPRIWMVMSRDGLLPSIFSAIHPKYQTPWFSTLVTGAVVAIPSLFMNLTEVTDLTSIGTLFAFVLVCGGILKVNPHGKNTSGKFITPYLNSKYIFPSLLLLSVVLLFILKPEAVHQFFSLTHLKNPTLPIWEVLLEKLPFSVFFIAMIALAHQCYFKSLSLIPVLGLSSCAYLMTELGISNWIRFGVWLVVGCFIYFLYGVKNSRLSDKITGSDKIADIEKVRL